MMKAIALDYDGTFTALPAFWYEVIRLAKRSGIRVDIVTLRDAVKDRVHDEGQLRQIGITNFVYCDGRPKAVVATERGLCYDVWIDDNPGSLFLGSDLDEAALAKWRENDKYRDKEVNNG